MILSYPHQILMMRVGHPVEGRVTTVYYREGILDEDIRESNSEQYLSQRLKRLHEHNYLKNLYDTGLYELRRDLRGISQQM
ncbi:hypothetical protein C453_01415 [Haloferax elongans ATCC BAA-1513]|uniref:Uncharacterized protein n=1 Tax=Haloferax elongans ATCC BAA-1513 TaxID=1230453 RepID=M0HVH3_HALEO|nr:hypothetical protein C453_01415 [Haloferax elongans ATCC BAA-1513]